MKEELVPLLFLAVIIFLSGCIQDSQVTQFKNDAVTIEEYSVYSQTPYSGGRTGIDFQVTNNGDNPVDVAVNFFDIPGFVVTDLKCENGETKFDEITGKCVFNDLESLDSRFVSIKLKATDVTVKNQFSVRFSVSYTGVGVRLVNIPIIDKSKKDVPTLKYYQSPPSYDPVRLDFEKTMKPEEQGKEYWILIDQPFEMKFRFTDVGTLKDVENVETVNLPKGSVSLNLINLKAEQPCDFDDNLKSNKVVEVPGDLICNFIPIAKDQEEYYGTIYVEFDYAYKYIKSETFTVYPR